jgi:hypothetical protein
MFTLVLYNKKQKIRKKLLHFGPSVDDSGKYLNLENNDKIENIDEISQNNIFSKFLIYSNKAFKQQLLTDAIKEFFYSSVDVQKGILVNSFDSKVLAFIFADKAAKYSILPTAYVAFMYSVAFTAASKAYITNIK